MDKMELVDQKGVSVVVPTLHSKTLGQTLQGLLQQTYNMKQVEILVVGLDTYKQTPADSRIKYISTERPVSAAKARNIGLAQACGEIVCFTDDDCVPASDWLEKLLTPYQSPQVAVVGGAMPLPERGYWANCDAVASAYEQLTFQPAGPRRQLPSLNFSARREVLRQMEGFSEDFPKAAGEDSHLSARLRQAGYTLWFTPQAIVNHIGWRKTAKTVLGHAHLFGQYSLWIREDVQDFIKPPFFFKHWLLMLLAAPLLAGWISLRMYLRHKRMWQYWYLFPGIYTAFVSWGLGTAHTLFQRWCSR